MEEYFLQLDTRNLLQDLVQTSPSDVAARLTAVMAGDDEEFKKRTVESPGFWRPEQGTTRWWNSRRPSMESWQ